MKPSIVLRQQRSNALKSESDTLTQMSSSKVVGRSTAQQAIRTKRFIRKKENETGTGTVRHYKARFILWGNEENKEHSFFSVSNLTILETMLCVPKQCI